MYVLTKLIFVTSLLTLLIKSNQACGGYSLTIDSVRKCDDNSVVYLRDFTITMDNNCQVTPKGCIVVTKQFKSALAHYTIRKPPMPDMHGTIDMCKMGKSKVNLVKYLTDIGLKCPMGAKTICLNGKTKISLSKLKNQMSTVAGKTDLMFDIEHDSGKTCLKTTLEIKK